MRIRHILCKPAWWSVVSAIVTEAWEMSLWARLGSIPFTVFVWVFCLKFTYALCLYQSNGGQKMPGPMELEFQKAVSCHVGAGDQNSAEQWVLLTCEPSVQPYVKDSFGHMIIWGKTYLNSGCHLFLEQEIPDWSASWHSTLCFLNVGAVGPDG